LRIATYNVNGVNGRLPRLVEWLEETRPDVACLQEIKTGDATFPGARLEAAGYPAVWHGQRSHHGVAVLARGRKPREIRRGLPRNDEDFRARYLEAEVDGLVVASVYVPNGNPVPSPNFDYKLAWTERFLDHAATLVATGRPTVLAGDFNVVPTNLDIYNAGAWRFDAVLQPETRALWQRLLDQGWIDVTRHRHPGERLYTFWVNAAAFQRNAGFRMDFLMVTPDLLPRVLGDGIDTAYRGREKPSDHTPAWIEIG
jgi:exodeoxyribonuclease III